MHKRTEPGHSGHDHRWHMALCAVLVVMAVAMALGGIGGAWVPVLLVLGCVAMMGAMMLMMRGHGGGSR